MIVVQEHYPAKATPLEWTIKWRQPFSLIVILACAILLFFSPPSWTHESMTGRLPETIGLLLVVIASMGRTWSSLYISGYKEHRVVCEGPYAIVRNPLYLFSFVGALGLGLATRHLSILIVITMAYLLYYPLVVWAEEYNLLQIFGQEYERYRNQVPRFIPRRLKMIEPDTYPVRPRHVRRSMQQNVWFFWAYLLLEIVTIIQDNGWGLSHFSF